MLKLVKFCGFSTGEQEAELLMTIATNTIDPDVRKKALKKGCSYQELRELILSLELQKDIEKRTEKRQKTEVHNVEVNAIGANSSSRGRYGQAFRSQSRFGSVSRQTNRFGRGGGNSGECERCGFSGHNKSNCPNKDKVCNKCHLKGHFAVKCRTPGSKRTHSPEAPKRAAKSAKINEVSVDNLNVDTSSKVGTTEEESDDEFICN